MKTNSTESKACREHINTLEKNTAAESSKTACLKVYCLKEKGALQSLLLIF